SQPSAHARRRFQPAPVLATDEVRRVRQVAPLPGILDAEEIADDLAAAVHAPAEARRALAARGVQPVIDRDLFARADASPREDLDAAAHRVRITGMVQVAARWEEDRACLEIQLAEVPAILAREIGRAHV